VYVKSCEGCEKEQLYYMTMTPPSMARTMLPGPVGRPLGRVCPRRCVQRHQQISRFPTTLPLQWLPAFWLLGG
jgi:hypothetical protein